MRGRWREGGQRDGEMGRSSRKMGIYGEGLERRRWRERAEGGGDGERGGR